MELSTTKLGHRAEWWELVAGWTEHLLSCNILTSLLTSPRLWPGQARGPWADRNLNFRMSVQAGCCVGTSAGDYPINPVEWSPVTSPGCPGKWGSNIPTKMKTITSLLIINTVQYRAHSSLSAGFAPRFLKSNFSNTQQGALQLITCGGDSSDTDMRAAMLSSTGGSWVLGSHCWHAGPGTTQPTNLRAMTPVHYTVHPECPGSVYGGISQDTNTNL